MKSVLRVKICGWLVDWCTHIEPFQTSSGGIYAPWNACLLHSLTSLPPCLPPSLRPRSNPKTTGQAPALVGYLLLHYIQYNLLSSAWSKQTLWYVSALTSVLGIALTVLGTVRQLNFTAITPESGWMSQWARVVAVLSQFMSISNKGVLNSQKVFKAQGRLIVGSSGEKDQHGPGWNAMFSNGSNAYIWGLWSFPKIPHPI